MVDGQPLSPPNRMVGVTPCSSEPLEMGLFFAGSRGAITLGQSAVPHSLHVPWAVGSGEPCQEARGLGPGPLPLTVPPRRHPGNHPS